MKESYIGVHCNLVDELFKLLREIKLMFPDEYQINTIGDKTTRVNKNIYCNGFYRDIMSRQKQSLDHGMYGFYFNLNDDERCVT